MTIYDFVVCGVITTITFLYVKCFLHKEYTDCDLYGHNWYLTLIFHGLFAKRTCDRCGRIETSRHSQYSTGCDEDWFYDE